MTDPAVEQPTAQAPPAKAGGGTVETGVEYMKSVPGILKIVEFVTLLIAFACGADVINQVLVSRGRMDFFLFVTITGWIIVIIVLVLFVSNLISKINLTIDWNIPLVVFAVVEALLLLIGSSLLADTVSYLSNHFFAAFIPLGTLRAAVAFGFISMFVFIGDAVVLFLKIRGMM